MSELQFEICIDSVQGASAAQEAGADRVELCAALRVGGVTPSAATIQQAVATCDLPVHVLIRPRAGDFCYDEHEWDVMCRDVELAGEWGAAAVVIGALRDDGDVDEEGCGRLIETARPLSVTFHRAFDVCAHPERAYLSLQSLGVDRLLTSGQRATAYEGIGLLRRLAEAIPEGPALMAGGGVDEETAGKIVAESAVRQLHFTGSRKIAMQAPPSGVAMGGDAVADTVRSEADPARIRAIMAAARGGLGRV